MSAPRTATIVLAAASATAICAAQTPAAGAMTLNGSAVSGGVATLDVARRVQFTAVANESAKTATVKGTDRLGNPIIETVTLPNATTNYTVQDFLTVTSITISAAAAGAISVGTNGVASTRWIRMDTLMRVFNASAAVVFGTAVTGTVQLEATLDQVDKMTADRQAGTTDESAAGLPYSAFTPPNVFTVAGMTGLSGNTLGGVTAPVHAVRLTVTAGVNGAPGVTLTVIQQGIT